MSERYDYDPPGDREGGDDDYSEDDGYGEDSYSQDNYGQDEYGEDNSSYYDYINGRSVRNSERFNDETTENTSSYVGSHRFSERGDKKDQKEYWWEGREKLIAGILLCWCCFCSIIIAVVLGIVLGGGRSRVQTDTNVDVGGQETPIARPTFAPFPLPPSALTPEPTFSIQPTIAITLSPTIEPTKSPTVPPTTSFAPTRSIPEFIEINADQDTFTQYNISKEYQGEEYGLQDTFLVQKVPLKDETMGDSIAIISFPLTKVPVFSRIQDREKSAVLRLKHEISTDERPSAKYTVVRIPETRTRVEYWHGFYFDPPEDDEIGVKVGPEFEVSPLDDEIEIDVSSLFFNYTLIDNKKPKRVFFMIENRGPDQVEGGDRFYTRESGNPPKLFLNFPK